MNDVTIITLEDLGVKGIENTVNSVKRGFIKEPEFHILREPLQGYNYWYSFKNLEDKQVKAPINAITSYALQNVFSLNNIEYTIKTDMDDSELDAEREFMIERADIEVCKLYGRRNN